MKNLVKKLENIFYYAKDYCKMDLKFFIFGLRSGMKNNKSYYKEEQINEILDDYEIDSEYKEADLSNKNDVKKIFMDFVVEKNVEKFKGGGQKSCILV